MLDYWQIVSSLTDIKTPLFLKGIQVGHRDAERFWRNHDTKNRKRQDFLDARRALEDYRRDGRLVDFPKLEKYLRSRMPMFEEGPVTNFDLSGYNYDDMGLTAAEYAEFEAGYRTTKPTQPSFSDEKEEG